MQQIFHVEESLCEYATQGKAYPYPPPPERCPHCKRWHSYGKHGFYTRNHIGTDYSGRIAIRRYICRCCGKTLSMLPDFCHPAFQYAPLLIWMSLVELYIKGKRQEAIADAIRRQYDIVSYQRQNLCYHRKRIEENVGLLEQGIRQVKSNVKIGVKSEDKRKRVQTVMASIEESGGFRVFWQKAHVEGNMAVLAQQPYR